MKIIIKSIQINMNLRATFIFTLKIERRPKFGYEILQFIPITIFWDTHKF